MSVSARYLAGGITLLILGLFLSIGWFFSHHLIEGDFVSHQLKDALVVDSTSSKGYYDWAEGNALNNPNYYVYYMWNITNPSDVLAGGVPIYQQVGPYYYKYIWYNRNATFLDDGKIVEYNLVEDYIFIPEMSASDPTQDMITTFNPAYVTILSTAGGDAQLIPLATIPFISSFVEFMTGEFLDVISSQYVPQVLGNTTQEMFSFMAAVLNTDVAGAEQLFYSIWANGTALPGAVMNWQGCFPNMDSVEPIPASKVAKLFSYSSLSLVDPAPKSIIYWLRAANNEAGPEAATLISTFSLSGSQLHAILTWRNATFIPAYVRPLLIHEAQQSYPIADWEDVGWVQFVTGYYTAPNSFSTIYGTWYPQFTSPFELGVEIPGAFTVYQAKMLLAGPYGILNIENFGAFIAAATSTPPGDLSPWGVTYTQAMAVEFYINDLTSYSKPVVTNLVNGGATGLILTRSADYWMWRCMDPLVAFLVGPENAYCGLQVNDTVQPPSQTYTGKHDISMLGQYVSWRNQTSVNVWNQTVNVYGWTDAGQFSPYIKDNQTLYVWDESFTKTLEFDSVGRTQVLGIDVIKYVLNQSAFAISGLYTNTIEGFANETAANQGAPILLSNFDFYGVSNPRYTNFSGLNPNVSDIITIYVEPITGNTLQADEKLQVNLYYPPEASGWNTQFTQFSNVSTDIVYPLLKAWQKSSVGDSQAKKLKDQLLYFQPRFNVGLLWGIIAFGALLVVISMVLIFKGIRARKYSKYDAINY